MQELDAIAIAVRFQAPIYTYENILDKAGVYLKIEEEFSLKESIDTKDVSLELEEIQSKKEDVFLKVSIKELHKKLEEAVDNENYEMAAKIRDEISKRS